MALQWAAFLRLHQVRFGYNRKDPRVIACLKLILSSVEVIDDNSDLETALAFPLLMAGSAASIKSDRDFIMLRLKSIQKKLKFNYLTEFEELLKNIWSRDNNEGHTVNWASIRYYQFPGLVTL